MAFADAVADPIVSASRVLAAVGHDVTDDSVAAMGAWLDQDRKRDALPVHRYVPDDFGLTEGQIRDRFEAYTERYL